MKIEKRNFVRVVCLLDDKQISATLQESDSVHVLTSDGKEMPVIELQKGDKIACFPDDPGRHLGEKIDEEIKEF